MERTTEIVEELNSIVEKKNRQVEERTVDTFISYKEGISKYKQ